MRSFLARYSMKFTSGIILTLSSTIFFTSYAIAEPANLSLVKKEVLNYHDSGAYQKELNEVIQQAHTYLLKQVTINSRQVHPKKLALVLDIDETSLSNYEKFVKRDFNGDYTQIHQEILAANSPAIQPMLSLYNDAIKNGVKVFFITGRVPSEQEATKMNLLNAGYKNWSGLYFRPVNYHRSSIVPFKSQTRATIEKQGHTVIATIGDQYSDLLGGFAKKEFKLPNPYYFIP